MKQVLLLWVAGVGAGWFVGWAVALIAFPEHVAPAQTWGAIGVSFLTAQWGYRIRDRRKVAASSQASGDPG